MFGIPGKQAVTMTPKAAEQIARLMASGGHAGLRIGVKKGGCAGMEYTMDYVPALNLCLKAPVSLNVPQHQDAFRGTRVTCGIVSPDLQCYPVRRTAQILRGNAKCGVSWRLVIGR